MKKDRESSSIAATSIMLGLALVATMGLSYSFYNQSQEIKSLEAMLGAEVGNVEKLASTLNELDSNIGEILAREGIISTNLNAYEESGEFSQSDRLENEIGAIENLLTKNRDLITELEGQVGSGNAELKRYKGEISRLEKRLTRHQKELAEARDRADYLEGANQSLEGELARRNEQIMKNEQALAAAHQGLIELETELTERIEESNKAYFAVGPYKALKEDGVVEKKGDFIGIGGSKAVASDLRLDNFVHADASKLGAIPVFAKKAELVSNHHPESYELVMSDKGQVEWIKILDKDLFWEATKYLVVVTRS